MKYGCIGVFKHVFENPNKITQYEERVVITEASSLEAAEKIILTEFKEYARNGIEFLDEYELKEIIEDEDSQVIEVACSMKVFNGTAEEYLERFFYDQRPASCDDAGWHHVWSNIDNKNSRCINCQEVREGQLWKKN